MKVLFVGLSNKPNIEPFDSSTKSGQVVDSIIKKINFECYKINFVNYAPIDSGGKLRYPTKKEIESAVPDFVNSVANLRPDLIVSFGAIVSDELRKIDLMNIQIICEKHPSYISVYKRKFLDEYIDNIVLQINSHCN